MRVVVIRCGALGDLVYATSVINALKMEFGEETIIDFVCTLGSGTLFKNDPRVNHVFFLKHKKIPILFSSDKKKIIQSSKKEPYDLLINFEFGKQFKTLVEAINAEKKVGALVEEFEFPQDVTHMVDLSKYLFKSIVSKDVYNKSFPKVVGSTKADVFCKYDLQERYIIISPSNSHQKKESSEL